MVSGWVIPWLPTSVLPANPIPAEPRVGGGAFGTMFFLNPEEDMLSIIMIQLRPYSHLRYREVFGGLTMQAITRSWQDRFNYKIRATNF